MNNIIKVCFIGVGSIATRHIKNLLKIYKKSPYEIQIDVCRSGKNKSLSNELMGVINNEFYSLEELDFDYTAIFITNPTILHYQTLIKLQRHSSNFFIEKPVFHTWEVSLEQIEFGENHVYYVACPLRYMKVIQFLKRNINFSSVYSVRAISSSYLPEWRAGTDYREAYSAHSDLGGGVSNDLIHEWDYLIYLLGIPLNVKCLKKKISHLEIDSQDIAVYIAEYPDKIVELHLDYFGRKAIRELQLMMKDDTVVCDLIEGKVKYLKSGMIVDLKEDRNDYQIRELRNFLNIINHKGINTNDIKMACQTLRVMDGLC